MLSLREDALRVVRGKPNSGIIVVPLENFRNIEARIDEIATVTPHKAPELLSTFNRAFLDLDVFIKQVELEVHAAKMYMATVKATILLDRAEEYFKERGIKGSADLRQALVDADPDYQNASERVNALESAREFLKGKQKGIEMAYSSVRKIIGESVYNHRNTNLNGTVDYEQQVGMDVRTNFGKVY
jgi:tetrahydromethanopterin S-methyltransferase subunit G